MSPFIILLAILNFGFQFWAISDCLRQHRNWLWILAVLFLGPLGALGYMISELLRGRRFGPLQLPEGYIADKGKKFEQGWRENLTIKHPDLERPVDDERFIQLEKDIAINPAPALLFELADLHAQNGDMEKAVTYYRRGLERDQEDIYARYRLGKALATLGRHAEAVVHLNQVYETDPKHDYGMATEALADALLASGQDAAACDRYEELTRTSSRSRPMFQFATLLDKQGRRDEARQIMQEIVEQESSLPSYVLSSEQPWIEQAQQYLETQEQDRLVKD